MTNFQCDKYGYIAMNKLTKVYHEKNVQQSSKIPLLYKKQTFTKV